jgi:molybdopterin converting factor small subunit
VLLKKREVIEKQVEKIDSELHVIEEMEELYAAKFQTPAKEKRTYSKNKEIAPVVNEIIDEFTQLAQAGDKITGRQIVDILKEKGFKLDHTPRSYVKIKECLKDNEKVVFVPRSGYELAHSTRSYA